MDLGVHLPLMQLDRERLSFERLRGVVDAARDCGFAAVSANDHFVFQAPWLDGPTALASVIERSGDMTLATTVILPVLRGPVPIAKALAANALSTMWTWVAQTQAECDRVLFEVLAPLLNRDPEELRNQVCIGSPEHCAQLLSSYAAAGCQRAYLWPLGDERRQLELIAEAVVPQLEAG